MANQERVQNLEGFDELEAEFVNSPLFKKLTREEVAKAKAEGEAGMLLRMLARRFGQVPEAIEHRVLEEADSDRLAHWADRVFDATDINAVFADD